MSTHHKKYTEPIALTEGKLPVPVTLGRGIPVSPESIRARAYQIFQSRIRNQRAGDATSDWLQAERELAGRPASTTATGGEGDKTETRGGALVSSIG